MGRKMLSLTYYSQLFYSQYLHFKLLYNLHVTMMAGTDLKSLFSVLEISQIQLIAQILKVDVGAFLCNSVF